MSNEHQKLMAEWKKDSKFKAAYDELADEFELFDQMLAARKKAGLTQADIARKILRRDLKIYMGGLITAAVSILTAVITLTERFS